MICISIIYIVVYFVLPLLLTEPLSVDCHLRVVRSAVWEIRANWSHLGLHLGIEEGTLDVSVYCVCMCVYMYCVLCIQCTL